MNEKNEWFSFVVCDQFAFWGRIDVCLMSRRIILLLRQSPKYLNIPAMEKHKRISDHFARLTFMTTSSGAYGVLPACVAAISAQSRNMSTKSQTTETVS